MLSTDKEYQLHQLMTLRPPTVILSMQVHGREFKSHWPAYVARPTFQNPSLLCCWLNKAVFSEVHVIRKALFHTLDLKIDCCSHVCTVKFRPSDARHHDHRSNTVREYHFALALHVGMGLTVPPLTSWREQMLEENHKLIQAIQENMAAGRIDACTQCVNLMPSSLPVLVCQVTHPSRSGAAARRYQQLLQTNLMRLAAIADAQPTPQTVPVQQQQR